MGLVMNKWKMMNDIFLILVLMNDFKNVKLQSIELLETTYTENHTIFDMCDSHKGNFRVIKKYY